MRHIGLQINAYSKYLYIFFPFCREHVFCLINTFNFNMLQSQQLQTVTVTPQNSRCQRVGIHVIYNKRICETKNQVTKFGYKKHVISKPTNDFSQQYVYKYFEWDNHLHQDRRQHTMLRNFLLKLVPIIKCRE